MRGTDISIKLFLKARGVLAPEVCLLCARVGESTMIVDSVSASISARVSVTRLLYHQTLCYTFTPYLSTSE